MVQRIFDTLIVFELTRFRRGKIWTTSMASGGGIIYYSAPLVIMSAIAFSLAFLKLRIKSSVVNFIAKTCLTIYIVHYHELLFPKFLDYVRNAVATKPIVGIVISCGCIILMTIIVSVIIDSLRQRIWKLTIKE